MTDDLTSIGALLSGRADAIVARLGASVPATPEPTDDEVAAERRAVLANRWATIVPPRLGDPKIDQLGAEARDAIAAWSADPTANLLITGPVGVGKSHAAFAAMRGPFGRGLRVAAVNVPRLLRDLRPSGDGADLVQLAGVDVLLLDDLGAERPTDWTTEQLYTLVNDRWEQSRPIIATTNLAPTSTTGPCLADQLGERIYSRLIHDVVAIRLTGADRRRTT